MMPLHFSKVFLPLILHLSKRHEKKELRSLRNSLCFTVDQTGLEPVTSRL